MANKKKTEALSPIQQLIAYAAPKEDKCILSLPISETDQIEIEVKPMLDVDEMESFVTNVTEALTLNNEYTPALYNLVFAKAILAYYTNLKAEISNDDIAKLAFETTIIREIESKINDRQLGDIIISIDKSVEFKKQEILNTQSIRLEESIRQIELLIEATSKISEQFNGIDMKQIADATVKLANLPEHEIVDNILDIRFGVNTSVEGTDNQE